MHPYGCNLVPNTSSTNAMVLNTQQVDQSEVVVLDCLATDVQKLRNELFEHQVQDKCSYHHLGWDDSNGQMHDLLNLFFLAGKLRAKAWILSWDLAKTSIEHRKLRFSGDQISFNFDDPMCADTLDAMAATMGRPLASDILPDDVAVGGDSGAGGGPVAAPRGFQAMMKAKAKARPGKGRGKAKVKAKARPRSCSKSSSAMFSSDSEASSASRPSSLMFSTSSASD